MVDLRTNAYIYLYYMKCIERMRLDTFRIKRSDKIRVQRYLIYCRTAYWITVLDVILVPE
jgi:hypothetical protein